MSKGGSPVVVGVDTGGTFTDLVVVEGRRVRVHKVRSTPDDPAEAVIAGLEEVLGRSPIEALTYGSTVATNALLEKKGARVAIVTNRDFEDLIEIGRQRRDALYDPFPKRPEPLIPRSRRFGIPERTLHDGTVARREPARELASLRRRLRRAGVEAIAVCLLHAYANPAGERRVARALERIGVPITLSSDLLREYREFERFTTAVVNAYVGPVMGDHLARIEEGTRAKRIRILQSDGTAAPVELARRQPVRTILSGPSGGVIGVRSQLEPLDIDRFLTLDMGGTSTDVSVYDGEVALRSVSHPVGYPVRVPTVDVHAVGAGGGSIARLDPGGALKVGPESAGADPGPACYGKGALPTVTDANLVLGRLVPEAFLGGRMALDRSRAEAAIGRLAKQMKTDLARAAEGVLRVVNASMERAIRVMTVERGIDPRELALVAFGGAGPLHAAELARSLSIPRVVLPMAPGLLCAIGAITAPIGTERAQTVRLRDPVTKTLESAFSPLQRDAERDLDRMGVPKRGRLRSPMMDVRYAGQSFEIEVPFNSSWRAAFHAAHDRLLGSRADDAAVEVVNLRVRARGRKRPAPFPALATRGCAAATAAAWIDGRRSEIPLVERETLAPGRRIDGPAILTEMSSTTWLPPDFHLTVAPTGALVLERRRA